MARSVDVMAGIADWIQVVSELVFMIIFILIFFGFNQRLQVYIWTRNIRARLRVLERYARDSRKHAEKMLAEAGAENPSEIMDRLVDYFVIEPVTIEPTDIIRRLDHVLNVREQRFKHLIERITPKATDIERSLAETVAEISTALNFLYKVVRHYLLFGEKTRNWVLIMQLELIMPQLLKIAETYYKAIDVFTAGKPIGDGLGALVAYRLMKGSELRRVAEDTVAAETLLENRKLIVVKAEGPGSRVGKPGKAVERIVEELNGNLSMIITVDAALKLEGEDTGSIAEGSGAAIGDPGPEKIRIERAASKYGIPLHAIVVKMGMEEAIHEMKEEIVKAAEKVVERIKELILRNTKEGDTVLVAGIGNTVGIAQ